MKNYYIYLIIIFQSFWIGKSVKAQSPSSEQQSPGEIIYRLGDQTFLAKYSLDCEATKGIYHQVFSVGDAVKIDFSSPSGKEQIQFIFSQLVFAEAEHQENLKAEVSLLNYSDMDLNAPFDPTFWVSSLREEGNSRFNVTFSPQNSSSASAVFLINVLDNGGVKLGSSQIAFNLLLDRPQPAISTETTEREEQKTFSEDDIWNIIQAENSVEGFEKYLLLFPTGKYQDLARNKLLVLKEKNSWTYLSGLHTCRAYKDYLSYYPNSMYQAEAEKGLKELGCDREQVEDSPVTEPSLEENETEETAYQRVLRQGTKEAYKSFLSQYPKGRYRDQVNRKVPFEVLQQDFHHDSMFSVVFAYVVAPLTISRIEVEPNKLIYTEEQEIRSVPQAIQAGNSFFWPEGKFKADISPIRGNIFRFEATLISGKKYWVSFKDGTGQVLTLELDSEVPSMEILQVEGLDATQDTLWVRMKGGIPPYYVRFVKRGEPFANYVHESELIGERGKFYLLKEELLKNMYLSVGIYEFFVLDKRKSQYKKNNLPILFSLDAGVNPYLWQYLAPVILLLIVILIIFYRRSALNT